MDLALTYSMALANSSQYIIKQSTEVENMVSPVISNFSYQCHIVYLYIDLDDLC